MGNKCGGTTACCCCSSQELVNLEQRSNSHMSNNSSLHDESCAKIRPSKMSVCDLSQDLPQCSSFLASKLSLILDDSKSLKEKSELFVKDEKLEFRSVISPIN